MLWIRGILFTILVPGTVAGYVPYLLIEDRVPDMDLGPWHFGGIVFFAIGALIYLVTALSFLMRGKGTPTIWFTAAISWLIGKEPVKMVSDGLYRYSRNPMYVGVVTTVLGEAIYFQQTIQKENEEMVLTCFYSPQILGLKPLI